jgi:hypothetical protein
VSGQGLTVLGQLPTNIQNFMICAIGLHVAAPSPSAASKALVQHLKAPKGSLNREDGHDGEDGHGESGTCRI